MKHRMVKALLILWMGFGGGHVLAQEVIALRGATLIDGTGAPAQPNSVIVVRGDRIEAIGQGIRPPAGARVIDVSGKYVTPGLWDKHLHYADWMPELLLTNGVTSVYAQAGGPWIESQREGILKGKILGPRMSLRIQSIDFYGSAEETRQIVRDLVERGADFIKLYTQATPEVARAAAVGYHYYFANPIPNPADYTPPTPRYSETQEVVTSISPQVVVEGSGDFELTVRGEEFLSTAVVMVGDRWLKTERIDTTELRATVPAELVAGVGTYPVRVVHRLPGWGKTNTVSLFVKFK